MSEGSLLGLGDLGRKLAQRRLALALSFAVTGGALWLLHRGALPVLPSSEVLASAPWWAPLLYGLCFLVAQVLRAFRWKYLVRPLARLHTSEIVAANFVFFAALVLLPLRLGEIVRPALLRRPGRLSAWQAVGLVGAERVVDGFFSSLVLVGSLLLSGIPARTDLEGPPALVRPMAFTMAIVFGLALLGIVLFFFFRRPMRRLIEHLIGLFSPRLALLIADKVESVAGGLEFLRIPRYGAPFVLISALYWCANVLAIWALLWACGIDQATWAHAGTVIGVLALGLLVPGAPGFFGTFQLSVYAGLTVYLGVEALAVEGAVVVFWMYVVQMLTILVVGAAALPLSMRRLVQAGGEDQLD